MPGWLPCREAGERGLNEGETALQPLTQRWQNVPSALRADPAIVAGYAAQLLRLGAEEEAEEVLRHALKQGFDATLVQLYGQVRGRDPGKQLQAAEGWLKEHPNDPGLLLTLGRLCLINKLWGKAREYLEASLSFQRSAETCAELGRLLAQLGEVEQQPVVPGGAWSCSIGVLRGCPWWWRAFEHGERHPAFPVRLHRQDCGGLSRAPGMIRDVLPQSCLAA